MTEGVKEISQSIPFSTYPAESFKCGPMAERERKKFELVALGGTFDLLHAGHKALLRKAFELGETVIVGVTSDRFAKKPHEVSPYRLRVEELRKFLLREGVLKRARIVQLDDPYGPTVTEGNVEAIVVSGETRSTAQEINRIRVESGFKPLVVVGIEWVLGEDGEPISTTRVRKGVIDKEGRLVRGSPE